MILHEMVVFAVICIVLGILGFMVWASASIRSGVYLKAFCREKTDEKVVYLTFDDGPADSTTEVLDILRERGACATFFIIGGNVAGREDIVRRILDEGHEIGIHSWSHSNTFPLFSMDKMAQDVTKCRTVLERLAGHGISLFRPPFGVVNPTIARIVRRLGLRTVGWSIRSFDTAHCSSPTWQEDTLSRILNRLEPGAVILLHDRLPSAPALLTALLDRLSASGYRFDRPCRRTIIDADHGNIKPQSTI